MSLEKVTLDNGLTIYNDRISGCRTNDVSVFVPYGSVDEQPGDEGVAHVFEHCVHLETDEFANRTALRRFDRVHGMQTNANTFYTRTLYYANGMELEPNIHRLSQILQHTHFPEDMVEHELKAVRREMATRTDDPGEAHIHGATLAMFGTPYGRSVGGYHDRINFDAETLKKLHERYYKLGRMALVVSGKAKTEEVVALANKFFAADADPTFIDHPPLPTGLGEHHRTGLVRDDTNNLRIAVGHPMTPEFQERFNENRLAFLMATTAMGEAAFESLRYDKGISYNGGIGMNIGNHPNAWKLTGGVTTDPENLDTALEVFDDVLSRDGSQYGDDMLEGMIATYKYRMNANFLENGARTDQHIGRLESYREPEDLSSIIRRLGKVNVAGVRAALDEIIEFVGTTDRYVHLTGTRAAIGDVERIIDQSEVA